MPKAIHYFLIMTGILLIANTSIKANTYSDGKDSTKFTQNKFDLYLLATQWIPGWCQVGTGKSAAVLDDIKACQQQSSQPLMYHGIWPEYNNASYPTNCYKVPKLDLVKLTITNPYDNYLENSNDFINHEWSKHGTCSNYYYKGLESTNPTQYYRKVDQFFHDGLTLYKTINIPTLPFTVGVNQLKSLIHKSNPNLPESAILIMCENSNDAHELHLTGFWFCANKNVNQFIPCPSQFASKISCHGNNVFTR